MERTITILGTIDNCKKAESLISAKLRASYESDMAQFIPVSVSGYIEIWRRARRGEGEVEENERERNGEGEEGEVGGRE